MKTVSAVAGMLALACAGTVFGAQKKPFLSTYRWGTGGCEKGLYSCGGRPSHGDTATSRLRSANGASAIAMTDMAVRMIRFTSTAWPTSFSTRRTM